MEYKSGLTPDRELKRKIQNAASAFWNSGGGILLAGVANDGTVDGGIPTAFGKQSVEEWLDQVLSSVRPIGRYDTRVLSPFNSASIDQANCVLAIQFFPSSALPHQSIDCKYYIRAGAHTVPASHDIVDALYAKRHFRNPRLVHLSRLNNFTSESDVLHIEVIAATDAVALDVKIDLTTKPSRDQHLTFPILVPIIDRAHPFGFRFQVLQKPPFTADLLVTYRDLKNKVYSYETPIDASQCVPPWNRDSGAVGEIADALSEINETIERKDLGAHFS